MLAAYLPGNSTVRLTEVDRPVPGEGQVLLAMKASTICGSDLRAIYREHLGEDRRPTRTWSAATSPRVRCSRSARECIAWGRSAGRGLPHQRLRAV